MDSDRTEEEETHSPIAISSDEEETDDLPLASPSTDGEEPDTLSHSSHAFLESRSLLPTPQITSPARSPGLFSSAPQAFTPVPERPPAGFFADPAGSFPASLMGMEFPGSEERPSKINSRHFTPTRHSTMASEKERLRSSGIDLGGASEDDDSSEDDEYVTDDDMPFEDVEDEDGDGDGHALTREGAPGLVLNEASAESEEEYFAVLLSNARVGYRSALDLLLRYQQVTMDQARRLRQRAQGGFDSERAALAEKESHILEQESFTWALVLALEQARLTHARPESWALTHPQRHAAILAWLEAISQEQETARPTSVFAAIHHEPSDTLCPPHGQGRGAESKSGFLRLLWTYVRAGRMDEAERLCQDCKQWWRFGSLGGRAWAQEEEGTRGGAWGGHPHRNVWKYTCWQLSEEASFGNYERALYASCCGNLLRMFEVCHSFQDHLWACFRVLIDHHDDMMVKNQPEEGGVVYPDSGYEEPSLPLPQGATCATIQDAFTLLQNNNIVPVESFEVIQAYMIQGEWNRVLEQVHQWMEEYGVAAQGGENQGPGLSPHLLRFTSHLYLHLRATRPDLPIHTPWGDAILRAYLTHLESQCLQDDPSSVSSLPSSTTQGGAPPPPPPLDEDSFALKKARAMALYTAQLSEATQQVEVYATFLSRVHQRSEAEKALYCQYAWEAGLDQKRINTRVFELVAGGKDSEEIGAFKFLCYHEKQRTEALLTANQLLRRFLLQEAHAQAELVVQLLPPETMYQVLMQHEHAHGPTANRVENACREHLCWVLYLYTQRWYDQWRTLDREQRASSSSSSSSSASTAATSAGTMGDVATMLSREERQQQWQRVAREFDVLARMTLQFPPTQNVEGVDLSKYGALLPRLHRCGWMVDEHPDAEEHEEEYQAREAALAQWRRFALPRVLFQWEEVMASLPDTGREIVGMADWVTDQQWQLYQSCTQGQVQQLLTRIRQAALRVLQTSRDPLGLQLAAS